MTPSKSAGPDVSAREEADGGYSLGVTLDGQYVPLYTVPGFRVAQLAENEAGKGNGTDDENGKEG